MNRRIFEFNVRFFNENLTARYILHFVYKMMPLLMFVTYPVLLIDSFFWHSDHLLKLTLVPLGVFLFVTALRLIINGKPSVFHKTTKGKSFPSRHTASAFIIAMAFLSVNLRLGIFALVVAVMIEFSRILAGAHYVHDVVAGSLISIIAGWIFFFVI